VIGAKGKKKTTSTEIQVAGGRIIRGGNRAKDLWFSAKGEVITLIKKGGGGEKKEKDAKLELEERKKKRGGRHKFRQNRHIDLLTETKKSASSNAVKEEKHPGRGEKKGGKVREKGKSCL